MRPSLKRQIITIMDELAWDDKMFLANLAEKMNLSPPTIRRSMRHLMDNGHVKCSGWGRTTR